MPFIIPSQQKETSTTYGQLPLQTDAIYPEDVSSKCATPKIAKTLSPIQLKRSNKLSNHRNLFKHMTLSKTFLSRATDGSDKMKIMEAVTTEDKEMLKREHSSPISFDRGKHSPMEAKARDESASIRSGEILEGENSKIVQEVGVNCFADKRRVKKKTLVRSLTVYVAASDEQSTSTPESKITLGKCGVDTKHNMDSPPVLVSNKPVLRGNTETSRLRSNRRPQLLKSQSVVDSRCEINGTYFCFCFCFYFF
ncbi:unnamed protein product [Onchocerca flexuosa]|uniref:Shugoshin_C domain-containing protein n=1 Tax=Onchocerca flexuosa TaxID=387005 RepID=A0A183HFW6_9BILA|nr:unnamed protein product [Onchocerca flexuosa]